MRRNPKQRSSFPARLEDESEMPVLEVPHATVYEPRRSTRGSTAEVASLDECYSQPAHCGISRDPGAVDAPTDHEQIERFIGQSSESARPAHCCRGLAVVRRARYTSVMLLLLSHR